MYARPGQHLKVHLEGVACLAKGFASKFGAEEAGEILGWTHDLAKAWAKFQRRLQQGRGKHSEAAPHAYPSAAAASDLLGELYVCVQGHHSQMRDHNQALSRLEDPEGDEEDAIDAAKQFLDGLNLNLEPYELPKWAAESGTTTEMFLRMCFSCLIDADRLNSESVTHPHADRGNHPGIATYAEQLRARLAEFPVDDRPIIQVRRAVQDACAKAALGAPGFYRLTVPTGGGKTLASLRFALEHAEENKLDRVIVAIPYTSIIEQTAAIYAEIFGEENVLAHHSADPIETDEDEDEFNPARRNAAENWDIPLVVTTNVRLFDSLFGNRPNPCRRLHNLARSVIILDEPQSLPLHLLEPCLEVLAWLVRFAGSTVVFCTATQPDYSVLPNLPDVLRNAKEIVENPEQYFATLRRVEYRYVGALDYAGVADRLRSVSQGLCIVNSRRDSLAVYAALGDPDAFYLSTLLCADHRREVLEEVKRRLKAGDPCRLVSTQVIEAGVDVDFPFVMRAMGPLESIVQAAGRANREGKMSGLGIVEIFDLIEGRMPSGAYHTAYEMAKLYVPAQLSEIDRPAVQAAYYAKLLGEVDTDRSISGQDGRSGTRTIQRARGLLDFETVSRKARLIDEDTISVVARMRDPERVDELLETSMPPRKRFRELGRYSVSLSKTEADKHQRTGLIQAHPCGAYVWTGGYDKNVGLAAGAVFDPVTLNA